MELTLGTWQITVQQLAPTQSELATMYDAAAGRWHRVIGCLGYIRAYERLFARLRADGVLGLQSGSYVLDCGIGTGAFSAALVAQTQASLRLDGVDISARMLARAWQNLSAIGVDAHLQQRSAEALPFADAHFDLMISAHMLEHLPQPRIALREMARVLKPGAPIVLALTRRCWLNSLTRLRWRYQTMDDATMRHWLRDARLDEVRTYELASSQLLPCAMSVAYVAFKRG